MVSEAKLITRQNALRLLGETAAEAMGRVPDSREREMRRNGPGCGAPSSCEPDNAEAGSRASGYAWPTPTTGGAWQVCR